MVHPTKKRVRGMINNWMCCFILMMFCIRSKNQSHCKCPALIFFFTGIPSRFLRVTDQIKFKLPQVQGKSFGIVGAILYKNHQDSWKKKLEVIRDLAWEKTDEMWEGRLAVQGRMQKSKIGMELAANSILTKMKIPLDEKRQKYEDKKK